MCIRDSVATGAGFATRLDRIGLVAELATRLHGRAEFLLRILRTLTRKLLAQQIELRIARVEGCLLYTSRCV